MIALIVGLGNPGAEYHKTRHNVGAWFVEYLVENYSATTFRFNKDFKGLVAHGRIVGKECSFLIPTTYMNKSGEAVAAFANFYKLPISSILVVHDDIDLKLGTVRLKQGGGNGGHHGLENITLHLHSTDFLRLRIGIDRPNDKEIVTKYVLARFKSDEQKQIECVFDKIATALPELMAGELAKAMNILHTKIDNEI